MLKYFLKLTLIACAIAFISPVIADAAEIDHRAVENYKKLKTKDILLKIEKGQVYIMAGPSRWENAKTNLKLIVGDKLKITPGTIAIINFYDEFDIHVPESEMTTIEPGGITQLMDGALFRTTYKDGAYLSEVINAPSKVAQYKFRGGVKNRDLQMEYASKKYFREEENENYRQRKEEAVEYLRARTAQARNFGNGFSMDKNASEKKAENDKNINYITDEKQRLECDVINGMKESETLKSQIIKLKADGINYSDQQTRLNSIDSKIRENVQKLDYANIFLRNFYESNNKINLKSKNREW